MIWHLTDCLLLIVSFQLIYMMNKFHIMNNIILMELISISLIVMVVLFSSIMNKELYFSVFVLVVFVSESVIVVSVVVSMIRSFGNDYLGSLLVVKI